MDHNRLADVIRVDRLRSREHVSAVAVAAAVHLGRVRFPCASSATLGNSTKRVNGRLALERRSGYRPWSRFSCRIVFFLCLLLPGRCPWYHEASVPAIAQFVELSRREWDTIICLPCLGHITYAW